MQLHAESDNAVDGSSRFSTDLSLAEWEPRQQSAAMEPQPNGRQAKRRIAAVMSMPRYGCLETRDSIENACAEIGLHLQTYKGVFWHHALQQAFMEMCENGTEWILCFDYDTMLHKGDIYKLLAHAKDEKVDALAALQPQRGSGSSLFSRPVMTNDVEACLTKVGTAHFGCTLIKVDALKRLKQPWFWEVPNRDGCWAKKAHAYGVHPSVTEAHRSLGGLHACDADIWFWRRWEDAGNSLYVDTDVRIGHAEETVSFFNDGGILDTIPIGQWHTIQAEKERKWKESGFIPSNESEGIDHPLKFEKIYHQAMEGRGARINSQFGEDGFIAACFELIGTSNKTCFEFGAHDGVEFSATKILRDKGWQALLIECDTESFVKLQQFETEDVTCVNDVVTTSNINTLLADLPANVDLGIIDVDGQDYYLWQALDVVRPRVVVIEYNPYLLDEYLPPLEACGISTAHQATIEHVKRLGREKGYHLMAQTFCNCIFVATEELQGK